MNTFLLIVVLTAAAAAQLLARQSPSEPSANGYFIPNKGQWPAGALYFSPTPGMNLWVTAGGVVFDKFRTERSGAGVRRVGHIVRLESTVATAAVSAAGEQPSEARFNYFYGKNSSAWISNVPAFHSVTLREFSPGVDLALQFEDGAPRYDFIVSPNADLRRLAFRFAGAESVRLRDDGAWLLLKTSLGDISTGRIIAYQEIDGKHRPVACRFVPAMPDGGTTAGDFLIGFSVGNYDRTRPLIIDPLVYSTFTGAAGNDDVAALAQDKAGNIIAAGTTNSPVFPVSKGAYDTTYNGGTDGFITKYDGKLSSVLFSTYFGGGADDRIHALALDITDNIYVAGETMSPSLPVVNAWKYEIGGGTDAFAAKLSADGANLLYSTFLGGSQTDRALCITVDGAGRAVIGGETNSANYPTLGGGYQTTPQGKTDGFMTRLRATGVGVDFSTYIGGVGDDRIKAVRYNVSGSFIYFAGDCTSQLAKGLNAPNGTFPEPWWSGDPNKPYDNTFNGGSQDVFVGNVSAAGLFSDVSNQFLTYLGSDQGDRTIDIELAPDNSVVVVGETKGGGTAKFPVTVPAFSAKGGSDVFFTRLNSNGRTVTASLLVGGSADDVPAAVRRVPASGEYYVIGRTLSSNFPVTSARAPLQSVNAGKNDAFIFQMNNAVSELVFSTYLGGAGDDFGRDLLPLPTGDCYVALETSSATLPLFPESNKTASGGTEGYIGKAVFGSLAMIAPSSGALFCPGGQASIVWQLEKVDANGAVALFYSGDGGATWILIDSAVKSSPYAWQIPAHLPPGSAYRVRAAHFTGLRDATGNFSLGSPASITVQPRGDTLCPGSPFRTEVKHGPGKYTFQWFKGTQQIANARDSVFSIPFVTPQDAGEYSVNVSSDCQMLRSVAATLVVRPQTRVVEQPKSADLFEGKTHTFRVRAVGANLKYQWLKDNFKLPGAVDSFYTIQSVSISDGGVYRAAVVGTCGTDTSGSAVLSPQLGMEEFLSANPVGVSVSGADITAVIPAGATATIELTDAIGRALARKQAPQSDDSRTVTFSSPALASGVYWLIVTRGEVRTAHPLNIIR